MSRGPEQSELGEGLTPEMLRTSLDEETEVSRRFGTYQQTGRIFMIRRCQQKVSKKTRKSENFQWGSEG
jgi:hypothetical protein